MRGDRYTGKCHTICNLKCCGNHFGGMKGKRKGRRYMRRVSKRITED